MDILMWIVAIILVASSILMCAVVLIQQTKSSGLGAAYGSETMSFSQRGKAASREAKLQKITVVLAIVIAVMAIALLVISRFAGKSI
ncbi:MAG: preprotein translocase subunit SecG [Clostridia bacterium]|nr:preprotein translocase subunit SecG [Clostridia bacterium]